MKSPDTRVGKWTLHSRWGKWDLKRLNRSGLPGNAAQQSPAQISTSASFSILPFAATAHLWQLLVWTLSWGAAAGLEHQTWDLWPLPPCCAVGAWCLAFHLRELMSCPLETKVARNILQEMLESHWTMCHSPNTSLPYASTFRIFLAQLNATSYKHLGLKPKITSSDNSTLAVTQTRKTVTGRGNVSPPNELRMLQYF